MALKDKKNRMAAFDPSRNV